MTGAVLDCFEGVDVNDGSVDGGAVGDEDGAGGLIDRP